MIILNCDQHRNLSFVDKKYRILQGEHKFDVIKINMPESIDGVDDMQGVSIKMHFVSNNEHIDRQVVLENGHISTDIDYTLTEKSKRWLLYLAFYVNVDGEVEIGKTNAIAIQVNKLPYSDTLAKEYKEPEIVLIKGDKGDKGDPGEDGKSAYEIAVEHGYEGTEEEWLSEMKDYNKLANKPQINGHTLSGNKSSDDLNLQGKLTAGNNITIEGNVISAEGGVTDYNELDNLPEIISANSSTGWGVKFPLKDTLNVRSFLYRTINPETSETKLNIKNDAITYEMLKSAFQNEIFKDYGVLTNPPSDFYTNESSAPVRNGIWEILPSSPLDGAPTTKPHRLINYYNQDERIQFVITNPQDGHLGEEQLFMRVQCMGNLGVWQELTGGGSQIVSGVVNANGTITFTDSEGNSFTTSGESVIGADGFSPSATVQQTASGATITVTDKSGTTTANISNGQDGNDYVLTAQDKSDIADIVLGELPNADTMSF